MFLKLASVLKFSLAVGDISSQSRVLGSLVELGEPDTTRGGGNEVRTGVLRSLVLEIQRWVLVPLECFVWLCKRCMHTRSFTSEGRV